MSLPTVLVVDDDPDICQLLVMFLACVRFDVLTACDGRDALHQRRDIRFRDIPIVCLSARHDARQTAARLRLSKLLAKPFELDAVVPPPCRDMVAA